MGKVRYIIAGNLIDGSGAAVRRKVYLAVKDGVIVAIGGVEDMPEKEGLVVEDFSHCIILPALVDCSVFLSRSPAVGVGPRIHGREDLEEKASLVARHIHYCHAHGVLAVAENDEITDVVDASHEGDGQAGILDIRVAGSDFVRFKYTGNVEDHEAPHSAASHDALYRELRQRNGKKTVVVANGRQQVGEALAVGCDAIEQGYNMGEDNLRKIAEQDVLWIPSVLRAKNGLDGASSGGDICCRFSTRYVAPGKPVPGAKAFWKKMLAGQVAQLNLARRLGVTVAVGTGAGSTGILHGESMVEEMKLLIKAGYSLEEAVRCASENGASFLGMEQLGMLSVGQPATFLITRGTVKQLPRKLAYLEGIYVAGAHSPQYRKNPVSRG